MCETAAKWIDSRARLQFRFFLNVFNCLLTTNLSRRNNRSRTGPQTLFNFRRNCNRQWIFIKFLVIHAILLLPEMFTRPRQDTWLIFHFTTMMQRNQSAHTAWVWFVNKSHQLEPIRLQGPPVISSRVKPLAPNQFKMGVIKEENRWTGGLPHPPGVPPPPCKQALRLHEY